MKNLIRCSLLIVLGMVFIPGHNMYAIIHPQSQPNLLPYQSISIDPHPIKIEQKKSLSFWGKLKQGVKNTWLKVKKTYQTLKDTISQLGELNWQDPLTWVLVFGIIIGVALIIWILSALSGTLAILLPVILLIGLVLLFIWLYRLYA